MLPKRKKSNTPPEVLTNLLITDAGAEGKAIAKHNGMVIFVPYGAPGDNVDVEVTYKRRNYCEAKIIKIHSPSPFRVEPFCKHFGVCGGCRWQHINYRQQLSIKQKHVKDNLERIAGIETPNMMPIIGADKVQQYRNKLEYTYGDRRWLTLQEVSSDITFDQRSLGFHVPGRFDKLVHLEECFLQPEPSNSIRNEAYAFAKEHDLAFFNLKDKTGFVRNLIVRTNSKNEAMLIWVVSRKDDEMLKLFADTMTQKFPQIVSMFAAINDKLNDSLDGVPFEHLFGEHVLTQEMDGLKFQIAPASFFQTNTNQAIKLYRIALEMAALTGNEIVYDLYTGTGTIAAYFSQKAAKVIGIEYVESAILDGQKNLELNEITNVELYHGDMAKIFNFKWVRKKGFPDVIVTDPPRAGMHPSVISAILELRPPKIVYISCNPATQARDLVEMIKEYDVIKVQPVDMFPQTHHVENIVLLHRKSKQTQDYQ
jgi:23S rRNA (uracil1939-C5)-methyltransferase